MKIIDAHVQIGNGVRMRLSVDALLGLMDEAGIDFAIVSPMDRYVAVAIDLNVPVTVHDGSPGYCSAIQNDKLGPERLLFGSDGGLGHPAITTAYLRRIDRLNAPQEHKEMIQGKNALLLINATR